jgi:AraC-like DNA-binding protein
MKLIKKLSEFIEDEIDGARCYAKMALELKDSRPEMARRFYNRSLAEMQHADDMHDDVVELIQEHRREHGEPPKLMMELYDYLHERHIEDATAVKVMQSTFKGV